MEIKETIKGYKGFDKDLKCRGFQYEVGKTYETDYAKTCKHGFHFCENPFDVFGYYPPCGNNGLNRFCEVDGCGEIDKDDDCSKIACSKIKIGTEIKLDGLIKAGVKFIFDKVKWNECNTGDQSAATVNGKDSIAIVTGKNSKAKGSLGCWIVLTERGEWNGETYPILDVKAFKVDGVKIKADIYYMLVEGELKEVE